ncbi:type I methionyl aminopeptidase [Canibacter zhoujuaniae]|uniref:type I methionyl aminopeptidase n=1 Tax=Canibacter zhoujuaniae TaxID=2708343 RepID=UPI0014249CB8|nr:type I methionyl aminopeptidase [Canibacter zhoujuaniae]
MVRSLRKSIYKSPAQLRLMQEPNRITALALQAAKEACVAGATLLDVDRAAEAKIRELGAEPNFMLEPGYKHTICANVNDRVVHAVPDDYVIQPGDIVSIDCGAVFNGWHGDSALTVVVPDPDNPETVARRQALSDHTKEAMWRAIAALATAKELNSVGGAVEDYISENTDYSIVEEYIGHGIGRSMHEAPPVYTYWVNGRTAEVKPGLCVAIEPIIAAGRPETVTDKNDGWTVRMADGKDSCQWEHSVAVHKEGIWVLTALDGGKEGLAPFGVTPVPIP